MVTRGALALGVQVVLTADQAMAREAAARAASASAGEDSSPPLTIAPLSTPHTYDERRCPHCDSCSFMVAGSAP